MQGLTEGKGENVLIRGVDITGAPRVEASLQASLIHTSASLSLFLSVSLSFLYRDRFNHAEGPARRSLVTLTILRRLLQTFRFD